MVVPPGWPPRRRRQPPHGIAVVTESAIAGPSARRARTTPRWQRLRTGAMGLHGETSGSLIMRVATGRDAIRSFFDDHCRWMLWATTWASRARRHHAGRGGHHAD